jgi:hypothetical protein
MQLIYLIKDVLTEEELASVLINTQLTPIVGALVLTPKGVKIAQDCDLDYTMMLHASLQQASDRAQRITEASGSPVAIIGPFKETIEEI